MEKLNLDYYYGNESEQFSFFRIPKVLFTNEYFKDLSAEAKVLYGILLDRMGLSRMNGWVDRNNRVYIIYPIEEIQNSMNCAKQKAVKLMAELDSTKGIGLIEKKRQGLGKPNLIYVKNFITEKVTTLNSLGDNPVDQSVERVLIDETSNFKKYENHTPEVLNSNPEKYENQTSGIMNNTIQEVPKSKCNNTNINYTDSNDIESNHIHSIKLSGSGQNRTEDGLDGIYNRKYYFEMIKTNIEYQALTATMCSSENIDNMVNIMVDICSLPDGSTVRVNGVSLPIDIVRKRFLEIDYSHIEYVNSALEENPTSVRNIRSYLITTLFNAPATISQYYRAKVNHDMRGR
jgi:hypothetical protein